MQAKEVRAKLVVTAAKITQVRQKTPKQMMWIVSNKEKPHRCKSH